MHSMFGGMVYSTQIRLWVSVGLVQVSAASAYGPWASLLAAQQAMHVAGNECDCGSIVRRLRLCTPQVLVHG